MAKVNTICYKLKAPRVYNEGTKYESKCSDFLACYGYEDNARNEAYIAKLNTEGSTERKEFFRNHYNLKAEEIAYFYAHRQEEFDTSD